MSTPTLCEFPFALSTNCEKTIAEDLGTSYYAPQGILGGICLTFAVYMVYQLVSVFRCKGVQFKNSLQHLAIYHSLVISLCLLARVTDLNAWSNRIPFLVNSLLVDYCTACSLSMVYVITSGGVCFVCPEDFSELRF